MTDDLKKPHEVPITGGHIDPLPSRFKEDCSDNPTAHLGGLYKDMPFEVWWGGPFKGDGYEGAKRAWEAAMKVAALSFSEGTTRWIPCAERKPDREGTYLIAHSGYVGTLVWDQGHGWQESYVDRTTVPSDYWNATITHWQPLPDSPK